MREFSKNLFFFLYSHVKYSFVGIEQCSLFEIECKCYDAASCRTNGRCEGQFVLVSERLCMIGIQAVAK